MKINLFYSNVFLHELNILFLDFYYGISGFSHYIDHEYCKKEKRNYQCLSEIKLLSYHTVLCVGVVDIFDINRNENRINKFA